MRKDARGDGDAFLLNGTLPAARMLTAGMSACARGVLFAIGEATATRDCTSVPVVLRSVADAKAGFGARSGAGLSESNDLLSLAKLPVADAVQALTRRPATSSLFNDSAPPEACSSGKNVERRVAAASVTCLRELALTQRAARDRDDGIPLVDESVGPT